MNKEPSHVLICGAGLAGLSGGLDGAGTGDEGEGAAAYGPGSDRDL
jgi:hypothetical protein